MPEPIARHHHRPDSSVTFVRYPQSTEVQYCLTQVQTVSFPIGLYVRLFYFKKKVLKDKLPSKFF